MQLVTAGQIAEYIEKLFPADTAEDFDNVGLLVGEPTHTVGKIMVMLDADCRTVDEAVAAGADMIITHHPVIFNKLGRINDSVLLSLIRNGIALFSAHTNLDSGAGGVNDTLAQLLNLHNYTLEKMDGCSLYGAVGYVNETTLGDFLDYIKDKLAINNLRYTGETERRVKKVGIIAGAAAEFYENMHHLGCDVFVTADLKYHQAQNAEKLGISVVDAGHFETENHICGVLKNMLAAAFDVDILISERKNSYIKYG